MRMKNAFKNVHNLNPGEFLQNASLQSKPKKGDIFLIMGAFRRAFRHNSCHCGLGKLFFFFINCAMNYIFWLLKINGCRLKD